MKKDKPYGEVTLYSLKKTLLIMRIAIVLIMIGILQVRAGDVYSQKTRLSVDFTETELIKVLDKIEEESEFFFLYNEKLLETDRKVSVKADERLVSDILDELFSGTNVKYVILDRKIILAPDYLTETILQAIRITGTVTDAATGEPLPGVYVVLDGTNTGVVTDANGKYSIDIPDNNAVIAFSYIGYLSEKVSCEGRTVIDIALAADVQNLEEVIVVGYGTQQKASVTGSVAAIKGTDVLKGQTPDVLNSLSGQLPGVMINTRTGEPGKENIDIFIRGRSTSGSTQPLIIIDGVERPDFNRINPNDIESISVLKDASAAIYGARAANGVILVTTKRGVSGPPVFNLTYNQGFSQPTRNPKMADSYTFASVKNEGIDNDGGSASDKYTEEQLSWFKEGTRVGYTTTDWFETMIKDYTPQSRVNLSVSGGNDALNYYLSLGKMGQDGHFEHGSTRVDRYNFRSNVTVNATKYLKVGLDVSGLFNDTHLPGNPDARGIYSHISLYQPMWTLYVPGTNLPRANRDNQSLINWVSDQGGSQDEKYRAAQTKLHFELDIPWVKGLSVVGSANYDAGYNHSKYFQKPTFAYSYNLGTDTYQKVQSANWPGSAQLTERFDQTTTMTINALMKYNKLIGQHRIGAMIGYEQMQFNTNYAIAGRTDYLSTFVPELFAGSSDKTKWNSDGSAFETSRSNYFGRLNYDFAGKYLAEFIFRADGSPNFPKNKRWGYFPGFSLGWRVSDEAFMDGVDFLDNLKLRFSYGQMGNDSIPPFNYLASYSYGTGASNIFVSGGNDNQTLVPSVVPNPEITWEVAKTFNFGIDASLWNGLLGIEFDVFKTTRSNILLKRTAVVPDYTGLKLPRENYGEVENHGFEMMLSHRHKLTSDLSYSLIGNFSFARNEVKVIDEAPAAMPYQMAKGHPLGSGLFYEAIGIYSSMDEVNATPHMSGAKAGDIIYKDLSGDGNIDSRDTKRIDESYTPEIVYSFSGSMKYKNVDFSFMFQGQENATTYFSDYAHDPGEVPQPYFAVMSYSLGNFLQWRGDGRWTPDNPDGATMPRASTGNFNNNTEPSTHWMVDAGFLRLKSLEIGYSIPSKILEKVRIKGLRAYVSGYNLFLIYDQMKDLGFDPETYDFWYYPPQRTYNFGFNLTF